MNTIKVLVGFLFAIGVPMLFVAPVSAQATQNIVEIAQDTEDLSTLVTAVVAAGLVDALSDGDADFTVFAPTNAAFDALPDGVLADLLEEENIDQLTSILTFHVVEGSVMSGDLSDGMVVTTLNGQQLTITIDGDDVFVDGAQVVIPDVEATNGVVHVINSVLLPEMESEATHTTADTGIVNSVMGIQLAAVALMGLTGSALLAYNTRK